MGQFGILLLCGHYHREFTSRLKLPENVRVCYNRAREIYSRASGSGASHVAITRIDSDDLMAPEAMAQVINGTIAHKKPDRRAALIFRKNLQWNIHNEFIGPHYRQAPPFVTHIFPTKLMRDDWMRFEAEHYLEHGRMGGRDPETVELGEHQILVVEHTSNISVLKRDGEAVFLTEAQRVNLIADDDRIQIDRPKMFEALARFGVDPCKDRRQWPVYVDVLNGVWAVENGGIDRWDT